MPMLKSMPASREFSDTVTYAAIRVRSSNRPVKMKSDTDIVCRTKVVLAGLFFLYDMLFLSRTIVPDQDSMGYMAYFKFISEKNGSLFFYGSISRQ